MSFGNGERGAPDLQPAVTRRIARRDRGGKASRLHRPSLSTSKIGEVSSG